MSAILLFLQALWRISLEAAPFLLLGFLVAALMHRYIPAQWLIRFLGKGKWKPPAMAALLGIPLPLCSCSVVPTALAIQKMGAPKGATLSFFIATPETGVDSIILSYGLLGPVFAIARPLAAGLSAISAGWMVGGDSEPDAAQPEGSDAHSCCSKPDSPPVAVESGGGSCCSGEDSSSGQSVEAPPKSCCEKTSGGAASIEEPPSCCGHQHEAPSPTVLAREWKGLRHSFFMLFDEVAFWIALGLVLSGLAAAFLPEEIFRSSWGTGWKGMTLAVLVGLPIYVCATASTPLAAVMVAKGFSVGAALVFLLVGPATNLGTLAIVTKMLGKRAVLSYLISIVAISVLFGWGVDRWFPESGATWNLVAHDHGSGASWLAPAAAGLLWMLLVWRGGFPRLKRG